MLLLASCAATRESYAAVSKFSTPAQLRNLRWDAITCLVQAINGLEVDAAGGWFDFMLVAYTQQKIVIPKKSVGETVNLEVDVLAKYVEKGLASLMERVAALEAKLQ